MVLESTTYPGTTRERLLPILEESGLAAGREFNLAYSPERIDPGRTDHTIRTTPKVVGGLTEDCRRRAAELYGLICDEVVEVSSPEVAELSKLLENIFRSVNIALVNELAQLCDRMGIDVWEVVDAAATKPFGFMRFEPGPGMGGHCLPVDPFYLAFKAREHDFYTEFIELAGKLNQAQPQFCVEKIERTLNDVGKPVNGSRVLLLGVAYKAGVGDLREAPALKIIRRLRELGAEIAYHDPHVPELPELALSSAELDRTAGDAPTRLHRHRPPRGGLRAGGARGAAGARLPRRDAGHRGGQPGPAVGMRGLGGWIGRRADPAPGRPAHRSAWPALAIATAGTVIAWEVARLARRRARPPRPRPPPALKGAEQALETAGRATQDTVAVAGRGLRGHAAARDRALQPADRVRVRLRPDEALHGGHPRRLVAVRATFGSAAVTSTTSCPAS